ncbi:hypothetical protein PINS_up009727 [Pythium insidiosum]|nr:hypothetical protein PINS_up009727 [Pythium insidiosum]
MFTAQQRSLSDSPHICKSPRRQCAITFQVFVSKIKAFSARQRRADRRVRPRQHNRDEKSHVATIVFSPWFERAVDFLILGNLIAILMEIQTRVDNGSLDEYLEWEHWMPLFSLAYLIEMVLKMSSRGFGRYFARPKNMYDCVVTLIIFTAEISIHLHHMGGDEWEWIKLLLLLRFLRCLRLLVALRSISTMFGIVVRLLPAFTTLYGMLGIVLLEYAAVGVQLFGGKLSLGDPRLKNTLFGTSNYYANNFNDMASAMTTLFEVLLVNNWNVIMEGVEAVTSRWSRIYFISFYFVAVIIVFNLVVAFVVEAYIEQVDSLQTGREKEKRATSPRGGAAVLSPRKRQHSSADIMLDSPDPVQIRKRTREEVRRGESVYVEEFL